MNSQCKLILVTKNGEEVSVRLHFDRNNNNNDVHVPLLLMFLMVMQNNGDRTKYDSVKFRITVKNILTVC